MVIKKKKQKGVKEMDGNKKSLTERVANQAQAGNNIQVSNTRPNLKALLSNVSYKARFEEILKDNAPGFISSLISVVNGNKTLQEIAEYNPESIIRAAAIAASLNLPIDPNLGFAYIIPYKNKEGAAAQFQIGYKGFIQLAMRTGQYETINATEIYEGELISKNRLTGLIVFDESKKKSDTIVGYAAYMKLVNGFEKTLYMTVEELRAHAKQYSQSYKKGYGMWVDNEYAMCLKTVLKLLLSKYGILSIQMQTAFRADHAIIKSDNLEEAGAFVYGDHDDQTPTVEIEGAATAEE